MFLFGAAKVIKPSQNVDSRWIFLDGQRRIKIQKSRGALNLVTERKNCNLQQTKIAPLLRAGQSIFITY